MACFGGRYMHPLLHIFALLLDWQQPVSFSRRSFSPTPTCTWSPQCLVSFKPVVCKTYILTYLGRILKAGDCHS
ncbi:hypothetical protein B0H13DRAFT_1204667 [Mycena leptocephala]|nr:hypothetical protein B0H13DRAFT_1204667 [Mycena leptocephala]